MVDTRRATTTKMEEEDNDDEEDRRRSVRVMSVNGSTGDPWEDTAGMRMSALCLNFLQDFSDAASQYSVGADQSTVSSSGQTKRKGFADFFKIKRKKSSKKKKEKTSESTFDDQPDGKKQGNGKTATLPTDSKDKKRKKSSEAKELGKKRNSSANKSATLPVNSRDGNIPNQEQRQTLSITPTSSISTKDSAAAAAAGGRRSRGQEAAEVTGLAAVELKKEKEEKGMEKRSRRMRSGSSRPLRQRIESGIQRMISNVNQRFPASEDLLILSTSDKVNKTEEDIETKQTPEVREKTRTDEKDQNGERGSDEDKREPRAESDGDSGNPDERKEDLDKENHPTVPMLPEQGMPPQNNNDNLPLIRRGRPRERDEGGGGGMGGGGERLRRGRSEPACREGPKRRRRALSREWVVVKTTTTEYTTTFSPATKNIHHHQQPILPTSCNEIEVASSKTTEQFIEGDIGQDSRQLLRPDRTKMEISADDFESNDLNNNNCFTANEVINPRPAALNEVPHPLSPYSHPLPPQSSASTRKKSPADADSLPQNDSIGQIGSDASSALDSIEAPPSSNRSTEEAPSMTLTDRRSLPEPSSIEDDQTEFRFNHETPPETNPAPDNEDQVTFDPRSTQFDFATTALNHWTRGNPPPPSPEDLVRHRGLRTPGDGESMSSWSSRPRWSKRKPAIRSRTDGRGLTLEINDPLTLNDLQLVADRDWPAEDQSIQTKDEAAVAAAQSPRQTRPRWTKRRTTPRPNRQHPPLGIEPDPLRSGPADGSTCMSPAGLLIPLNSEDAIKPRWTKRQSAVRGKSRFLVGVNSSPTEVSCESKASRSPFSSRRGVRTPKSSPKLRDPERSVAWSGHEEPPVRKSPRFSRNRNTAFPSTNTRHHQPLITNTDPSTASETGNREEDHLEQTEATPKNRQNLFQWRTNSWTEEQKTSSFGEQDEGHWSGHGERVERIEKVERADSPSADPHLLRSTEDIDSTDSEDHQEIDFDITPTNNESLLFYNNNYNNNNECNSDNDYDPSDSETISDRNETRSPIDDEEEGEGAEGEDEGSDGSEGEDEREEEEEEGSSSGFELSGHQDGVDYFADIDGNDRSVYQDHSFSPLPTHSDPQTIIGPVYLSSDPVAPEVTFEKKSSVDKLEFHENSSAVEGTLMSQSSAEMVDNENRGPEMNDDDDDNDDVVVDDDDDDDPSVQVVVDCSSPKQSTNDRDDLLDRGLARGDEWFRHPDHRETDTKEKEQQEQIHDPEEQLVQKTAGDHPGSGGCLSSPFVQTTTDEGGSDSKNSKTQQNVQSSPDGSTLPEPHRDGWQKRQLGQQPEDQNPVTLSRQGQCLPDQSDRSILSGRRAAAAARRSRASDDDRSSPLPSILSRRLHIEVPYSDSGYSETEVETLSPCSSFRSSISQADTVTEEGGAEAPQPLTDDDDDEDDDDVWTTMSRFQFPSTDNDLCKYKCLDWRNFDLGQRSFGSTGRDSPSRAPPMHGSDDQVVKGSTTVDVCSSNDKTFPVLPALTEAAISGTDPDLKMERLISSDSGIASCAVITDPFQFPETNSSTRTMESVSFCAEIQEDLETPIKEFLKDYLLDRKTAEGFSISEDMKSLGAIGLTQSQSSDRKSGLVTCRSDFKDIGNEVFREKIPITDEDTKSNTYEALATHSVNDQLSSGEVKTTPRRFPEESSIGARETGSYPMNGFLQKEANESKTTDRTIGQGQVPVVEVDPMADEGQVEHRDSISREEDEQEILDRLYEQETAMEPVDSSGTSAIDLQTGQLEKVIKEDFTSTEKKSSLSDPPGNHPWKDQRLDHDLDRSEIRIQSSIIHDSRSVGQEVSRDSDAQPIDRRGGLVVCSASVYSAPTVDCVTVREERTSSRASDDDQTLGQGHEALTWHEYAEMFSIYRQCPDGVNSDDWLRPSAWIWSRSRHSIRKSKRRGGAAAAVRFPDPLPCHSFNCPIPSATFTLVPDKTADDHHHHHHHRHLSEQFKITTEHFFEGNGREEKESLNNSAELSEITAIERGFDSEDEDLRQEDREDEDSQLHESREKMSLNAEDSCTNENSPCKDSVLTDFPNGSRDSETDDSPAPDLSTENIWIEDETRIKGSRSNQRTEFIVEPTTADCSVVLSTTSPLRPTIEDDTNHVTDEDCTDGHAAEHADGQTDSTEDAVCGKDETESSAVQIQSTLDPECPSQPLTSGPDSSESQSDSGPDSSKSQSDSIPDSSESQSDSGPDSSECNQSAVGSTEPESPDAGPHLRHRPTRTQADPETDPESPKQATPSEEEAACGKTNPGGQKNSSPVHGITSKSALSYFFASTAGILSIIFLIYLSVRDSEDVDVITSKSDS